MQRQRRERTGKNWTLREALHLPEEKKGGKTTAGGSVGKGKTGEGERRV